MLNIVHIQYSSKSAGRAAVRLQNAFLAANINSSILSLQKDVSDSGKIKYLGKKQRLIAKVATKINSYLTRNSIRQFGSFSYPVLGTNVAKLEEVQKSDIIYIHWVMHGFMDFKSIRQLAKLGKPIVFYMHDMWNITGGCHYNFSCEKYIMGCNNCQIFPNDSKYDFSARGFIKKLEIYSKFDNLYFVAPSNWLYDCAKQSLLTKNKPVFYIPNTLDKLIFKPFEKKVAKEILNIDVVETVIAFGAFSIDSPYKGWPYLQKALEILKKTDKLKTISVLIFGKDYNKEIADAIPFKTIFLGYLQDEYTTVLAYNASDIFIAPSLADNLPFTVMESLSCGTPVVGFDIGGIPDMIKHKENGYLAKYKDPEDIAQGIMYCLNHKIKGYTLPENETALTIKKHQELFDYIIGIKMRRSNETL